MNFTVEEMNTIAVYNTGSRQELLYNLQKAESEATDPELLRILTRCIKKISALTDEAFSKISFESADEEGGWSE